MSLLSRLLSMLFSGFVSVFVFVAGLVWIMIDASSTTPGWHHLAVFVACSIWLMVSTMLGFAISTLAVANESLVEPMKEPCRGRTADAG